MRFKDKGLSCQKAFLCLVHFSAHTFQFMGVENTVPNFILIESLYAVQHFFAYVYAE